MALSYDVNVFKDVYRLILKMVEDTQGFPREEKYTLGQDMKRDAIVLVRSMYWANKARSKTEGLEAFLDDVEILKLEVRLRTNDRIKDWIPACAESTPRIEQKSSGGNDGTLVCHECRNSGDHGFRKRASFCPEAVEGLCKHTLDHGVHGTLHR